ncbi:MAG: patatin-like phospholipase family protein [Acidobacteria bacterium]|nr:patatin-like phospholipase family protein [Acidobacteriota bacterium]
MKDINWKDILEQAVGRIRRFARRLPAPRPPAPRVGLALGGGFARGLAHIGVLKVLEENGVQVSCLAGTSIGSIIGGAYASGVPLEEIAAVARRVRWKDFGNWTLSRMGLASNQRLEALVRRVFRATRFEDLKMPMAVVATDLLAGRPVVFTTGELGLAIRASCAYPGLFLPIAYDGSLLVDGGLVSEVPAAVAKKLGADIVIGVALQNLSLSEEPKSVVDVLGRSFSIAQQAAEPIWRQHADLVVEPTVSQFNWDDFGRADELMAAGADAMRAALPRLRGLLQPAPAPAEARRAAAL